jgi:hypothetical protein
MEDEKQQRARFREEAVRMPTEVSLANAVMQRFFLRRASRAIWRR